MLIERAIVAFCCHGMNLRRKRVTKNGYCVFSVSSPVQAPVIDELGYVPLSATGAELLFEVFSQRYERGSSWSRAICRSKRMDRPCSAPSGSPARSSTASDHVHILEMKVTAPGSLTPGAGHAEPVRPTVGQRSSGMKSDKQEGPISGPSCCVRAALLLRPDAAKISHALTVVEVSRRGDGRVSPTSVAQVKT